MSHARRFRHPGQGGRPSIVVASQAEASSPTELGPQRRALEFSRRSREGSAMVPEPDLVVLPAGATPPTWRNVLIPATRASRFDAIAGYVPPQDVLASAKETLPVAHPPPRRPSPLPPTRSKTHCAMQRGVRHRARRGCLVGILFLEDILERSAKSRDLQRPNGGTSAGVLWNSKKTARE